MASEVRIEVRRVVEEAAAAHVGLARLAGIRVVQVVEVPAAVSRERPYRVPAAFQELPELLRRVQPAGETAAHRHDRDRFAGRPRLRGHLRWRLRWQRRPEQEIPQMGGQRRGGRMVEHQRRGQAQPGRFGQPGP
jgi:hypothetical protein